MQSQMFIDSFWMQEIFGINAWMQDDEIDEMVETEQIFVDEMVEMVRIDDKY